MSVSSSQQRFFTLSGGGEGSVANAKHESQISELNYRVNSIENCSQAGMLYGVGPNKKAHSQTNSRGCIDSLKIDSSGDLSFLGDVTVSGDLYISDEKLQEHALRQTISCETSEKLQWNSDGWYCQREDDPSVGALYNGKWCAASGGVIVCDKDSPSTSDILNDEFGSFLLSNVRDFALKDGFLPNCAGGEILIADGNKLKCLSLDSIAAGTLVIDDLADVEVELPARDDLLYFDGLGWKNGPVVQPFTKVEISELSSSERCEIGNVITFDGDGLMCVPDIGGPNDALLLEDMADVSGTADATATNILYFDGQYWKANPERDLTVSQWAKLSTPIINLVSDMCDAGHVLTFDGTQLSCIADAGGAANPINLNDIDDVSLTAPVDNQVLAFSGGNWINQTETDPNVQAFALNANPLPNCPLDHILTADGLNLSCTADAGSAANGISLDDLTDVDITAASNHDIITHNGTQFMNKRGEVCAADEVLTYDGSIYSCVKVTDLGLWTDNVTYIEREKRFVVNDGQALPAALEGAGVKSFWYPSKASIRSGEVTGTQWDDSNIGNRSVALGYNSIASSDNSVAIAGENALASGNNSVAIGGVDVTSSGDYAVAIAGQTVTASGINAIALGGQNTVASGDGAVALGGASHIVSGDNSAALGGQSSTVSGDNSVAINLSAAAMNVTNPNTMSIMGGNLGVGVVAPATRLHVDGTIKLADGGEACSAAYSGSIRYVSGNIEVCDGAAWGGVTAGSVDWSAITSIPTGVSNIESTPLTTQELSQLQNIDASTMSTTQWGYVGALNQGVATGNNVQFNRVVSPLGYGLQAGAFANPPTVDSFALVFDNNAFGANLDAAIFNKTDSNSTTPDGGMIFSNTGNNGARVDAMAIRGTGRIGMGTLNPSEKLEVVGTVKATAFTGDGSALTNITYGESDPQVGTVSNGSYCYASGGVVNCNRSAAHVRDYVKAADGAGSGLDADLLDGLTSTNFMRSNFTNGYDGLQGPNAGTSNWVRTTTNGLIPYQSGGASSLGTSSWPFSNIYANNIYDNGTEIGSKFLGISAKAADANLLDGIDSSAFIRSNADDLVYSHTEWQDAKEVRIGTSADLRLVHDGSNSNIRNYTGDLYVRSYAHGNRFIVQGEHAGGTNRNLIIADPDNSVTLYYAGSSKLATASGGVNVTGQLSASTVLYSSDRKYKENIKPLDDSLEKINNLQGVSFDWKVDDYPEKSFKKGNDIGLIAQDLEKVYPELVNHEGEGATVNYAALVSPLIEAVKELTKRNEELEKRVKQLEESVK